jgi:DNA-directed RNA polymerase subunit K/omega
MFHPHRYPHITWSPCAAHACDLALEDIIKLSYFAEVNSAFRAAITFINNHHATRAAWRELSPNKILLRPGETRFASAFTMLERALEVREQLEQLVVSDKWNTAVRAMEKKVREGAAADTKRTMQDEQLWRSAEQVSWN